MPNPRMPSNSCVPCSIAIEVPRRRRVENHNSQNIGTVHALSTGEMLNTTIGARRANLLHANQTNLERVNHMRYGIAWLLGVPVSVLVIWWLVTHVL